MICLTNLTKTFGELHAVRKLSFSISNGCVVGLLGPNGAGKTTVMRMLTTFLHPTSGSATVANFDIVTQAEQVRRNIGYLPENPAIYAEMTVLEFLTFVAKIKKIKRSNITGAVSEIIDQCSLSPVVNRLCGELSRGYRQRVGLAQALIHRPKVVILDEPTTGLDPAQIIEIRHLIKNLGEAHTVLLSTHILSEVIETCTNVVIIAQGRLVDQGSVEELTKERNLEARFLEAVSKEPLLENVTT